MTQNGTTQPVGGTATPSVPGGDAAASTATDLVSWIQSAVPTTGAQIAATVFAILVLVAVITAVRRAGPVLKERLDDRDLLVESAQATAITTTVAALGLFVIVVWRGVSLVGAALPGEVFAGRNVARTVLTVGILAGATLITRVTKRAIRNIGREQSALSDHQSEIAHHVVQVSVYVISLIVVFAVWGVNPGSLLVGAGFAGIVLGLAARQTLGAVLAGFVVLFSRPFELGDWVVIDDQEGVVTDITIVNTQIRTFDDEYVMIPNDLVTDTDVVNRSRKGRLRLNVDVALDYDTDLEEAIEVAEEAMRDHKLVLSPPEPHAVLTGFEDSAIGMRLRFYISNPSARKMWKARTRVTVAVKRAFDDAGIKIPFPQRELSGRPESGWPQVPDDDVPPEATGESPPGDVETDGAAAEGASSGGDDA
ncbi:mechanosensitive ion channel family protein [Halobaculum magnesiiphilum]|uniref:Mechanosensitive ion channel family protein n=1 Tax=Halobaculum magnesiiphilum TaxID=1017351 RepID=A0A8T8WDF9_9EURY|nr:mechanosensitive ion channel family protein [Halobaculum magnesiiphilum]QZP37875.1 mechanosensitive ion channel family protein [Halobaculum magnesiiphilum]